MLPISLKICDRIQSYLFQGVWPAFGPGKTNCDRPVDRLEGGSIYMLRLPDIPVSRS